MDADAHSDRKKRWPWPWILAGVVVLVAGLAPVLCCGAALLGLANMRYTPPVRVMPTPYAQSGTPVPHRADAITPANAGQVTYLAGWG
ncbi:MAG: hypothetical protein KJ734_13910, partial [Chloroflexi bacterium]|nr:hypothetical protein [Chloroflexota bacterium]